MVSEQEAINVLSKYAEIPKSETVRKAYRMAISALEKQTPKKPLNIESAYNGDYGDCPICKKSVSDFSDYRICHSCGQALDWSDTK